MIIELKFICTNINKINKIIDKIIMYLHFQKNLTELLKTTTTVDPIQIGKTVPLHKRSVG